MADDNFNSPHNDDEHDASPSALFLEMMRQVAMRDSDQPDPDDLPQDADYSGLEFHLAPELDEDSPDPPDTVFIPENDLFPDAEPADNDVRAGAPEPVPEPEPEPVAMHEPEPEPESAIEPEAPPEEPLEENLIAGRRVPIYTAPDEPDEDERIAKLEAQRVRRLRRRQQRRQRRRVGIVGGFFRTVIAVFVAAVLASTIFTWFTDPEFFTPGVVSGLQVADSTSVAAAAPLTPTAIDVTPNWARRIGIVSGHRGPENDPGAVCDDGLTENEINFGVAQLVVRNLREAGYSVDLLDEFDPRLVTYQAAALISIHANDCRDYGEFVSGYLVARAAARAGGGPDDILAECVAREYADIGIQRRFSLTVDMTDYHTFREIHPLTPAAIIELGFMKDDRDLLVNQQPLIAERITEGVICFLNGENPIITGTEFPTLTPEPSVTPIPLNG